MGTTRRKEGHEGEGEALGEVGWRGLKGVETGSSLHCLARSSCRRPSKTPKSRRKPGDSTGGYLDCSTRPSPLSPVYHPRHTYYMVYVI